MELTIETKAGILPIQLQHDHTLQITMQQAPPQFQPFEGSLVELAEAIGIGVEEIDRSMPTVYGSTGIWTLLVPIKQLETFERMKSVNGHFPSVLKEMPSASIHPFCLETYDPNAQMHARHFSSPFSGTIEDPVTGTASGVMGAYYAKNIQQTPNIEVIVEQGQEIGRDGRVQVRIQSFEHVEITGTATYVDEFDILF